MNAGLIIPESYKLATDQAKARNCNGCGTKGLGGWLVPDTLWGLSIEEVCNIHDWMYATGEDKETSDLVFFHNMMTTINSAGGWKWLQALRRHRAVKYYLAVADFGGAAFAAAGEGEV